ncbi:MAG: hypothetical protein ACT4PJ_03135 [Gemmatimonadaceae bacterium]
MRNRLQVGIVVAALGAALACGGPDDGGPAYLQTTAAPGRPPRLDSVTHIQVIPPVTQTDEGMNIEARTVTDRDSIGAIIAFIDRKNGAWKRPRRGLSDPPRGSLFMDFYVGPALVATVVDREDEISLQGHRIGLIQDLSREDRATLRSLGGVPPE